MSGVTEGKSPFLEPYKKNLIAMVRGGITDLENVLDGLERYEGIPVNLQVHFQGLIAMLKGALQDLEYVPAQEEK